MMYWIRSWVLVWAVLLGAATAPRADEIVDPPKLPANISMLMQDRQYPRALAAIEEASKAKDVPRDYLAFLKGQALYLAKEYPRAAEAFSSAEKEFPRSPWARRARFARGLARLRAGDFRDAEVLYRDEVISLLSEGRKHELAAIYLEFADAAFKPAKEDKKPDYNKALQFYNKALAIGPKPDRKVEIELAVARCHQELNQLDLAINLYAKFAADHKSHPLAIEAKYRHGDCQLLQNRLELARKIWQDLLAEHRDAKSERIAEAGFHLARTYQFPNPINDESLNLGTAVLHGFLQRHPLHALASKAHLWLAQARMHRGRHEDAVAALKTFLADERYSDRPEVPDARALLGNAYLAQKKFLEALEAWRDYLAKHPAHQSWSNVQQNIVNTEYLMGQDARAAKRYAEAVKLWTEFALRHPLDGRNATILFEFGQMEYEQQKWESALTQWRRLVAKHPNTNESSSAQYHIGLTIEEKLGQPEEALKEYRKVTWGEFVGLAQQRIHQLTAKTLQIVTERVFRSDETPKIKLRSRNIDSVTVRVYTVDLETYFRKMHLSTGLESLDISLIDPDRNFEFKVPGFAEYRELESLVSVPLPAQGDAKAPRAGVMAVTISSKTLEATTMVLQSDLDLIAKSSRDEVFVFAQNLLTGKPWAKAKLLISDGQRVFGEVETGADGVFHQSFPELRAASGVRVFAFAGGNVASNVLSLNGVGVAKGLESKGYIYTDRPAYRAGQMVHVRGLIREVNADEYLVPKGKKFVVEVFDPRNRLLRQADVTLSEYGSFHTNLVLPAGCPQGDYRILAREPNGKSYQGSFQVHEYQLEPVRLTIKTPRKVYYRGETIEGKITAAFYYGTPLASRELTYQLLAGEQVVHSATTDAKGQVSFKFPTREFRETQTLRLRVTLPERNLMAEQELFLSAQGFSIRLSTVRPVYLAGETFEVETRTRDPEGKPVGQKMTLEILEVTNVDGRTGEKLVQTIPIQTKDGGVSREVVRLEKGGNYVLRAKGIDQFENPITGQRTLAISDDSDRTRLRILAEKHTYRAGDVADIKVHWRDQPTLALVTYQGARILGYRLVQLQKGANTLQVPMNVVLAPNFDLAINVMTDARVPDHVNEGPVKNAAAKVAAEPAPTPKSAVRFHEASAPFSVERNLQVGMEFRRKGAAKADVPLAPGEEVEVLVSTTDPQGAPIAAEVSVGLVEQALLDRFGDSQIPIADFFKGVRRESAMVTASSVTFAYHPATKAINTRFLAEADRLALADAEKERLAAALPTNTTAGSPFYMAIDSAKVAPAPAPEKGEVLGRFGKMATQDLKAEMMTSGDVVQENFAFERKRKLVLSREDLRRKHSGTELAILADTSSDEFDQETKSWSRSAFVDTNNWDEQIQVAPTEENLHHWGKTGKTNLWAISNGAMFGVNVDAYDRDGQKLQELARQLTERGAMLLPTLGAQETGFWNPAVVTNKEGKATVNITLPERSTAWRLRGQGITTNTLAGDSSLGLVVKKNLFGDLKLPLALTDGDQMQVLATVTNDVLEKGEITLELRTTLGNKTATERKVLKVKEKGQHEVVFPFTVSLPDEARSGGPVVEAGFTLVMQAGEHRDVVRRTVPVRPYGMPVYAIVSGSASSDTSDWVELPAKMPVKKPTLQIVLGPNVERSLLDVVLGPPLPWQAEAQRVGSALDMAASDLMASLGLMKLIGVTREVGGPRTQALDGRVRSSLSLLTTAQRDDGGWSWTGKPGDSNRFTTARVVWALALARQHGYTVQEELFNKALNYLRQQIVATADNDYESKAVLLHAMAAAGQGDFTLANRLHRNRPALSNAALAYLALALAEMDRKPLAEELLTLLANRLPQDTKTTATTDSTTPRASHGLPWNQASTEIHALFCLALQKANLQSARVNKEVDWLLANRTGTRWTPEKATGPAMLALTHWFQSHRDDSARYQLTVSVNDRVVKEVTMDGSSPTQTVDVPMNLLKPGKQRIHLAIQGRGRYTYQCILGGFVDADKLTNTVDAWYLERYHEPAPRELDGKEIPRGFGILQGNYQHFRNPLTQVPVGKRGLVEIHLHRHHLTGNESAEQLPYLVVTEPLPSGATVSEQSVRGGFERFEIAPGTITFYIGSRRHIETIRYELSGYVPGSYRAGPTVLQDSYQPDRMVVAKPKALTVLPLGATSDDPYRLTPQELLEFGKRLFAKRQWKQAGTHLSELLKNWNVQPNHYRDVARMLLDIHLEVGPPSEVVRYFEIIKEKYPELEFSFDKIVKVGAAYHEMGEYERSYLIFRATVESNFLRESAIAGFLREQGEFLRSVSVMQALLREYPPEAYVAGAAYALTQEVYAMAPKAAQDPNLRERKVLRVDLIRRAHDMLDHFLTEFPEDPACDQAAFSLANTLLDLKAYKQAAARAGRFADRYPQSDFLDSFWYIIGYSHFALGEYEDARKMFLKVADAKRRDKATGQMVESNNKWRAIYILGQVYHSLGKAADAIREYARVSDRYLDAKQAIEYFSRKEILLPEVSTFKPGDPAKVELKFRNVAKCDIKVYRIDLIKFGLLHQDLTGITKINLAGIRPFHELAIDLGDGKDYRDRTREVVLPLKEEGAYLVVCRGEDLHTSGLALVTPLQLEVQLEASSGRVRATLKRAANEGYVPDVHVKVIGSRNSDFISGQTDLRGVFVADGIHGRATVLAQAEGTRYAFYRGQLELGPVMEAKPQAERLKNQEEQRKQAMDSDDLLDGLQMQNRFIQEKQQKTLKDFYLAPAPAGVKAEMAR